MKSTALAILVIDDDEGDRELVRRSIRGSGLDCLVFEASAFKAALTCFADRQFDLILIDNSLPDGDGVHLIEDVHRIWGTAGVALVTGMGSEDLAAGAIKNGAVDYISKRNIDEKLIARVIANGVRVARLRTRIQSQNEALQRFARVLAHDLRSPLQAVRLLAEAMVEGAAGSNRREIQENAEMMMLYSDRLTQLIASLEQYNKLNHTPKFEITQADALLDSAIENLAVEIGLHDVRFEREPLPWVRCSPTEIIRLFQNLVSNAIKYRSDAVPIVRVWAEPAAEPGVCTISVADNGIGIPGSERETVFDEFRRLHAHSEIQGTGLGLSMCRRIVERHGGRIWCEPADGGGTVFRFDLPASSDPCNTEATMVSDRARQSVY